MAEVGDWIERSLTRADLVEGAVGLGPAQQRALGLPDHAVEIDILRNGSTLCADWDARDRKLRGELVAEWLSDEAQENQIIRLRRGTGQIEAHLVPLAQSSRGSGRSMHVPIIRPERESPRAPKGRRKPSGLRNGRYRLRSREEFDWVGSVGFERASLQRISESLADHGWDDEASFDLRLRGEHLAVVSGFDELLALDLANVDKMDHQVDTVRRVLGPLKGRAILADEVGLGKTIEAGLIASELVTRGMVRRLLVLCPAGLRDQWASELAEKFNVVAQLRESGRDAMGSANVVMSVDLARRDTDATAAEEWDLVIVDEAHKHRGPKTRALLAQLNERSRFVLYLTATPVQNSLDELYELVENVRPGTFVSKTEFRRQFVGSDARTPTDPEGLRRLVRDVMVRTTRAQAGLDEVERLVEEHRIKLSAEERADYETLLSLLRAHFTGPGHHLRRQNFARRLLASPRALAVTLLKANYNDLPDQARVDLERIAARAVVASRTQRQQDLVDIVAAAVKDPARGKVLVFTQHTEVAEDLLRQLDSEGIGAVSYHGGISSGGRRKAVEEFRRTTPVMVATDAGAEGLNLQFCNCVVNYDLPWNPMKIEQRIGRVHRVGQRRDVHVVNMYAIDTVEDRVYELLRDKLKMFELLFGQITMILGEINEVNDATVEQQITDAVFSEERAGAVEFNRIGYGFDSARKKAQDEIATAERLSYLSTWDDDYRNGLTREGADELRPDRVESTGARRAQVISFVVDLFEHVGATVERSIETAVDDGTTQQTFMTVQLPETEQGHFGGVDQLHVAFEPAALTQHREAELCAVGSDLFEELVDLLRSRGDLLVEQPVMRLADGPLLAARPALAYSGRTIVGPAEWSADASWSVRITGPTDDERVISTGSSGEDGLGDAVELEVLGPANDLPATVKVDKLLASVRRSAAAEISVVLKRVDQEAAAAVEADNARRREHYATQIADVRARQAYAPQREWASLAERVDQLQKARSQLGQLAAERARAECELLALRLTGSRRVVVRERWSGPDGRSVELDVVVDAASGATLAAEGADGRAVSTVACCAKRHVVDESSLVACDECGTEHCQRCNKAFVRADCAWCRRSVCISCIVVDDLCRACANPVLLPDTGDGLGRYRLGDGSELTVGRFAARLNGDRLATLDRTHPQLMELAGGLGVSADSPCHVDEWPCPPGEAGSVRIELDRSTRYEPRASAGAVGLDADALAALRLDPFDPAPVGRAVSAPLVNLVERLRTEHEWPDHAVAASERGAIRYLQIGPDDVKVVRIDRDLPDCTETTSIPWVGVNDPLNATCVAAARLTNAVSIAVDRMNDSYVVTVHRGDPAEEAVAEAQVVVLAHGVDIADERALASLAVALEVPGARLGRVDQQHGPEAVENAGALLVSRDIAARDGLSLKPVVGPAVVADLAEPRLVDGGEVGDVAVSVGTLWDWARDLDGARPDRVGVGCWYDIVEKWVGDGEFEHRYSVEGGEPPVSPLPGEAWFAIDIGGHPVGAAGVLACDVCGATTCSDCDSETGLSLCGGCGQPACGRCRSTGAGLARVVEQCVSCDRHLCRSCGRSELAIRCAVCDGTVCHHCADDERCGSCAGLHPATMDDLAMIAPDLAPPGHQILVGDRCRLTTVVIMGGTRRELVALDESGTAVEWRTATAAPASVVRLTISASRFGPVSDIEIIERTARVDFDGMVLENTSRRTAAALHAGSLVTGTIDVVGDVSDEGSLAEQLLTDRDSAARVPVYDVELLGRLGDIIVADQIPAGTPVVIRVAEEVSWLEITAEGFNWCRSTPDDLTRSPVELSGSGDSGVVELGGTFGPEGSGTVRVRGFGEAVEVDIRISDLEKSWVVTDDDGWPGRHAATEAFAASHGIDRPVQLVVGDVGNPADPPEIAAAVLTDREWSSRLAPASDRAGGERFPDALLRSNFEVEPSEIQRVRRVDFLLPERFRDVMAHEQRGVSLWHRCTEIWHGDGERVIEYEVEGGSAPPPPVLDDTGEPAWEFQIDQHGHLVGFELECCDVCAGSTCSVCDDDQGIRTCDHCGQPACGDCRAGAGIDSTQSVVCACCGSGLCGACRRLEIAETCAACRRLTCHHCIQAGACATCRNLTLASKEEVDRLPVVLRFAALDVRVAEDRRHKVVLARGGMRSELAVLKGGHVEAWWDLAGLDPDEWALASSVAGRVSGIVRSSVPDRLPAAESDLVVRDDRASWAQVRFDGHPVFAPIELQGGVDLVALVAATLEVEERPLRTEPCQRDWLTGFDEGLPSPGSPLNIESYVVADRVNVVPAGVQRLSGRSDDLVVQLAAFEVAESTMFELADPAMSVRLPLAFDRVEVASCDGVEAAKLWLGPVVYLVVSSAATSSWWRVDSTAADPSRVLLGRALTGRSVEIAFSAVTRKNEFTPISVKGAVCERREQREFVERVDAEADPAITQRMIEAFCQPQDVLRSAARPPWATQFQLSDEPSPAPEVMRMDVHVEELWALEGASIPIGYRVVGGSTHAVETAYDSGELTDTFTLDRSDHLVANVAACSYCGQLTCIRCDDRVELCAICTIPRCGRCGPVRADVPLCSACGAARPVSAPRKLTKVGLAGLLVRGEDSEHQVEVALTSSRITVAFTTKDGNRTEWQVDPEHGSALAAMLAGPGT